MNRRMATKNNELEELTCHKASVDDRRGQFGNRFLTNPSEVYKHNAWDNVDWDEAQEEAAIRKIEENSKDLVSLGDREKYEAEANEFWNKFYLQHQHRFFKDRHWLFTEFEELSPQHIGDEVNKTQQSLTSRTGFPGEAAHTRIFEVGCGVGNTVFPVLQANSEKGVFIYCCDFAESAVNLVKEHPDYDKDRCHAFLCDISSENPDFPFPKESLDIIVLIFVLSAIDPSKMQQVINTLAELLRPGGKILFRDYGQYDMAQLRFKNGKCLEKNFYVRGDGTRVYFFSQEELATLFRKAGLSEEQNYVDRRLQVNRGKQLKMYRVWIQCKYRKAS